MQGMAAARTFRLLPSDPRQSLSLAGPASPGTRRSKRLPGAAHRLVHPAPLALLHRPARPDRFGSQGTHRRAFRHPPLETLRSPAARASARRALICPDAGRGSHRRGDRRPSDTGRRAQHWLQGSGLCELHRPPARRQLMPPPTGSTRKAPSPPVCRRKATRAPRRRPRARKRET